MEKVVGNEVKKWRVKKGKILFSKINKTKILNEFRMVLWKSHLIQEQLLHLVRGKRFDSFFSKFLPNHYQFSRRFLKRCERFGLIWELDLSQLLEWVLYFDLREDDFEFLFGLIGPGQIVFDVGANFGFPGMYFSKLVGPDGRVFCFEPFPESYSKLRKNVLLNSASNISLVPFAVGDVFEEVQMESPNSNNSGQVHMCSDLTCHPCNAWVSQTTLDHFVEEREITKVDLIKVDVEGFETRVFRGAREIIHRFRPVIFFELSDALLKRQSSSAAECLEYLASLNYRLFEVPTLEEITRFDLQTNCHKNVLARI